MPKIEIGSDYFLLRSKTGYICFFFKQNDFLSAMTVGPARNAKRWLV